MNRTVVRFFGFAAIAILSSPTVHAQDKSPKPKVVLDLDKPARSNDQPVFERFGKTCDSYKHEGSGYRVLDKAATIGELMGSPIKVVKIRRYGRGWKKPEDVRAEIAKLLERRTGEVYAYEPWDEMAYADIVATVQFSDDTEGTLEDSGAHVCFTDHSGTALWTRFMPRN
jgi:hypothetical protein